jgi:Fe-S-cluster-containing hydrogenase component 2
VDIETQFIVISCPECTVFPCLLKCSRDAAAFFYGNVMIDKEKCAPCPRFTSAMPSCVADCAGGGGKKIIECLSAGRKRERAVHALSQFN